MSDPKRTWAVCIEVPAYYWFYVDAESAGEAEEAALKAAESGDPRVRRELDEYAWLDAVVVQPAELEES